MNRPRPADLAPALDAFEAVVEVVGGSFQHVEPFALAEVLGTHSHDLAQRGTMRRRIVTVLEAAILRDGSFFSSICVSCGVWCSNITC